MTYRCIRLNMDFEPRQSAVNKRKWSGEEECEFEEKKRKIQSDTDLNGSLPPSIYHGKESLLEQQVSKIQPIKIGSENDDQQGRGNKNNLDSDCFRERGEFVAYTIHRKEILPLPVGTLTFESETTFSTNLTNVKEDKDGNYIELAEDSRKNYRPIEVSSTNNLENGNNSQAQSP
ncbi:uncharacterized protein LOC134269539 [Saccostrea cucullata]|uniref:uncharacterized protein LOC134269539 n=1 Tax=Saccostrea cuccullata TaxID=36930 RepID=UPI002ED19A94